MKFNCDINMDNAAFGESPEVELTRILKGITECLAFGDGYGTILDINGNKVGQWSITD